jgi:sugar/nucleoside kinase (ribokinase family)
MAETGIELLCVGNALVDVFAQGEEYIDVRFGLTEAVQHIGIAKMMEILTVLPDFTVASGGGAANVGKIAGMLGIRAAFIGAVGAAPRKANGATNGQAGRKIDHFGAVFERDLAGAGVRANLPLKKSPTGACLMLQMSDGRTVVAAAPSAALELTEDDIDEGLVRQAAAVVIDGFMLGRQKLVRRVLELANRYGTVVALDVSSTGLVEERTADILTYARAYPLIIFMNEDEARAFYQVLCKNKDCEDDEPGGGPNDGLSPAMINLFKDFTSNDLFPVVTVKLGKRGAVVFAGGNVYREETIPVIPLEATGAGDAFCAAFLAAWIRNKSLGECAALGNKAAKEILAVNGTKIDPKVLKHLRQIIDS